MGNNSAFQSMCRCARPTWSAKSCESAARKLFFSLANQARGNQFTPTSFQANRSFICERAGERANKQAARQARFRIRRSEHANEQASAPLALGVGCLPVRRFLCVSARRELGETKAVGQGEGRRKKEKKRRKKGIEIRELARLSTQTTTTKTKCSSSSGTMEPTLTCRAPEAMRMFAIGLAGG